MTNTNSSQFQALTIQQLVTEMYDLHTVKVISGDQIKKTEMGRTCGTYGWEERCIQGFNGETWGKETTWKTQA
jgi:hypothetical protein